MERIKNEISSANVVPATSLQALFVLGHGLLLQSGFLCVVEQASGVPGFEPSIREIPSKMFIPTNWTATNTSDNISLIYKLRSKPGKIFSFTMVSFDENTIVVTFSQRNAGEASFELVLSDHVRQHVEHNTAADRTSTPADINIVTTEANDNSTPCESFGNFEIFQFSTFEKEVTTIVERILPGFNLAAHRTGSGSTTNNVNNSNSMIYNAPNTMGNALFRSAPPPPVSNLPSSISGFAPAIPGPPGRGLGGPRPANPLPGFASPAVSASSGNLTNINSVNNPNRFVDVGRSDLDPFSNITMPGGRLGGGRDGPGNGFAPPSGNSGNLVGPNHPMFAPPPDNANPFVPHQPQMYPTPAFLPQGFQPPQPRYDPIGPVFPHNQEIEFGAGRNTAPDAMRRPHPGYEGEPNNDLEPVPFGDQDFQTLPSFAFHNNMNNQNPSSLLDSDFGLGPDFAGVPGLNGPGMGGGRGRGPTVGRGNPNNFGGRGNNSGRGLNNW